MLSFFPLDVLDEICDLIESVSEGFLPTLVPLTPEPARTLNMFIRLRVMLLRAIWNSFLIHRFAR